MNRQCLSTKLKTVFFSVFKKFIIPEDNILEAKEELAELQKRYPERQLELIPLNNFEGIFQNLKIVDRLELTLHQKMKSKYYRYQTSVNLVLGFLLIISLIISSIIYLIPHLDRNPILHYYVDNHYSINNNHGIELWWSEDLSSFNKEYYFDKNYENLRCILTDVDGDNKNELIYLNRSPENYDYGRMIFCSNENIKTFPIVLPLRNLNYPNNPVHDFNIFLKGIYLLDWNNDSKNEILFWGNNIQFYPTVIGSVDFKVNIISEFWNEGMPILVKFYDLNKDGKKEIF